MAKCPLCDNPITVEYVGKVGKINRDKSCSTVERTIIRHECQNLPDPYSVSNTTSKPAILKTYCDTDVRDDHAKAVSCLIDTMKDFILKEVADNG